MRFLGDITKHLTVNLKKNKKIIGNCSITNFCSSIKTPLLYDFKSFIKKIEKAKSFKKSSSNLLKLESIKTPCLDAIGKKLFDLNPWLIVNNKLETKKWIKKFKEKEINNKLVL